MNIFTRKISFLLIFTTFIFSQSIQAQEDDEEPAKLSWKAIQVADGLYMLTGDGGFTGGNLALSVGDDGVILIDDAMPSTLDIMNDAIKGITDKPIDFLINTHVHGDHTGNNTTMGENGVHIVAHENMLKNLLTKGVKTPDGTMQPAAKSSLPVITFAESIDFHLNGLNAHVFHLPHAHTDGDAAIHFTDVNVIHVGDTLFNKMFPFIDFANGGSLDGYIQAQMTVLAMVNDDTKIIPGHGQLANKQDLADSVAMLKEARKLVSDLVKAGKSEAEILALNPLKEKYEALSWGFITTEKMTQQVYQGVQQTASQTHIHSHSH